VWKYPILGLLVYDKYREDGGVALTLYGDRASN